MSSRPLPVTRAQGWALTLAGVGTFMVVLDLLAVSTALPSMQASLHASLGVLAWTVNAYTLSFAVLLLTASALGDRWGRRGLYAGGLALFAVSSMACALAPDVAVLLTARAVQGASAAVIVPLGLALLNAAFPPHRRGWAMGIYGSLSGLATVLGPVVGGALTQALSWQWIFWLNVPVGLLAAVATACFIANSRGTMRPLDLPAVAGSTVSMLALVWGIIRAATAGWGDREVVGALAVGVVALGAVLLWERRAPHPMIPLRLFRGASFAAGNAAIFAQNASLTAAIFFTAQFFQDAQAASPLAAGLRLLPLGLVCLAGASRSGAMADRIGPRALVPAGLAVQAVGIAALAALGAPHRGYPALGGSLALVGLGIALALPALTKAVVGSVEPADIGIASGLFSTLRQLGGAFGVAVASAAFSAAGGYGDPARVAAGYGGALYLAAALGALGALAAAFLRARRRPSPDAADQPGQAATSPLTPAAARQPGQ